MTNRFPRVGRIEHASSPAPLIAQSSAAWDQRCLSSMACPSCVMRITTASQLPDDEREIAASNRHAALRISTSMTSRLSVIVNGNSARSIFWSISIGIAHVVALHEGGRDQTETTRPVSPDPSGREAPPIPSPQRRVPLRTESGGVGIARSWRPRRALKPLAIGAHVHAARRPGLIPAQNG